MTMRRTCPVRLAMSRPSRRRTHSVELATVLLSVAFTGGCREQGQPPYAFTELAFPGAAATTASGINAAGHIVGWYERGDSVFGFVYRDGAYTSVQHPGAVLTQLNGIGSDGAVVGSYRKAGESESFRGQPIAYHGFLLTSAGEVSDVKHPDHRYSMAMKILADQSIIGCYHDEDWTTTMRGMRVGPNGITSLADPATMHLGATPDGRKIVGLRMEPGRAYVVDNGDVRYFDAPRSLRTEAWDITPSSVVVGVMVDSASVTHGYVLENGRFTIIDAPGAKSTVTFGINAQGDIVGGFLTTDGRRLGYVASRAARR